MRVMDACTGVILAAGHGRRMGELGETYPKTLLPVGDRSIIRHHTRLLLQLGIRDIIVVVGHRADQVSAAIAHAEPGTRIRFVTQNEPLGSADALGRVRSLVTGPIVALLGDYFFSATDAAAVMRRLAQGTSAIAVKREPEARLVAEACAVSVDGTGRVTEIVEKPMVPGTRLKGCGMYACTPDFFDAVARTPRTALRNEYELTVALELFVASGRPLFAEEIVRWDANLTRPLDLLECNLRWLEETQQPSFAAMNASVGPGAILTSAVVGAGASIGQDARVSHSVVFPSASVAPGAALQRAIVTPAGIVQC
jgi:NDP-sugar pyrophosphorylase family protein